MTNENYAKEQTTHGALDVIVVDRERLLNILRENLKTHNDFVKTAREGYKIEAKEKIRQKKLEVESFFQDQKEQFGCQLSQYEQKIEKEEQLTEMSLSWTKAFNIKLDLSYPEDKSDFYESAIQKIELSVFPTIQLTEEQFECFVRNNWAWKKDFLQKNLAYLNTAALSGVSCLATGFNTLKEADKRFTRQM